MIRFLIIMATVFAIYWCFNNVSFSNIANKTATAVQNEKTIKAVHNERQTNYNYEQSVINNN